MAHYILQDQEGKIIEEYDYLDPIPFVDKEFEDGMTDLKAYIDTLPEKDNTGLTKLFRVLKRLAQASGLQE